MNIEPIQAESQNKAILRHLKEGNSITPLEALNLYGCFRLGARIHDLKRMFPELEFQSEMIQVGQKRVKRYWVDSRKS